MALEPESGKEDSLKEVLSSTAPYPLSGFYDYTKEHLCEENVDFYRDAEEYVGDPNLSERNRIVQTYIEPGSLREVNIQSTQRYNILERSKTESEPTDDIFAEAQTEILNLLRDGPYNKFMQKVKRENLNTAMAKQARFRGYQVLALTLAVEAVIFGLQVSCDPTLVRGRSS